MHRCVLLDKAKILRGGAWALEWACVVLAVWFAGAFVYVAMHSMAYPYDLEWLEGQIIDTVQRVVDGKPLYARPTFEYVPFPYTPLYYYASALVALFTGMGFFPARLVSFIAALGCGVILYHWIRREKGSWKQGLIVAGLFFATYPLSGRWFDVARVDSMFLCLVLGGLYVFYFYRGGRGVIAASLLLVAAFFTKQTMIVLVAPLMVVGLRLAPRHTIRTALLTAGLLGLGVIVWNAITDHWFGFYVFEMMAGHGVVQEAIVGFWRDDLCRPIGVVLALCLGLLWHCWKYDKRRFWAYAALLAGGICSGYSGRLHMGGYINVLMPMHAMLALLAALALVQVRQKWCAYGLVAAQLWLCWYAPSQFIPSERARAMNDEFIAAVAKLKGDALMTEIQFVPTMAGQQSYPMLGAFALAQAQLGERSYIANDFWTGLGDAVASGRFSTIVQGFSIYIPNLDKYYHLEGQLPERAYVTGAILYWRSNYYVRN